MRQGDKRKRRVMNRQGDKPWGQKRPDERTKEMRIWENRWDEQKEMRQGDKMI